MTLSFHRYNASEKGGQLRKGLFGSILASIFGLVISAKATAAVTSLAGTSGLINIPTAEVLQDGELAIGVSYISKPFAALSRPNYSNIVYYSTIGYLPFLEISLRATVRPGFGPQGIGDRMVSVRVRLIKEKARFPALAVGIQDILGNRHFNALYLVSSKTFAFPFLREVRFHFGIGTDWMDAVSHQLVGIFGGLDTKINKYVSLMLEYDTERFSIGSRFSILPCLFNLPSHIRIDIDLLGMETLSGGFNFSFQL